MARRVTACLLLLALWAGLPRTGWADTGVNWRQGPALTEDARYAGVLLSNDQFVLFSRDATTNTTLDLRASYDFGTNVSSVLSAATGLTAPIASPLSAIYVPAAGRFMIAGTGSTVARSFIRGNAFSWTTPTVTITTTAPADLVAHSLLQQGGTLLAALDAGATDGGYTCRSTNNGAAWTCTARSGERFQAPISTAQATGSNQAIATPGRDQLWLALANDNTIYRSTDDGVTWTSITTPTTDTGVNAILCASRSVCVVSVFSSSASALRIYRSTDAGATWGSAVLDLTTTATYTNLLHLGSGVLLLLGDPVATTTPFGYRSVDFGETWLPIAPLSQTTPLSGSTFLMHTGLFANANQAATVIAHFCTAAPACAARVVQDPLPGESGTTVTANQGTAAGASSGWPVRPSDGSALYNLPERQPTNDTLVTNGVNLTGQLDDTSPSAPTENQASIVRITSQRGVHVQLRSGATEAGTASVPLRVDPTGTTTQPVSGTVTANAGTGTFTVSGTVTATQGTAAAGTSAWPMASIQGATLFNSVTTGAANTAVTVTIAAATGTRAHLYGVDARCSAGTATLDVDDGATGIWDSASGEIGTTTSRFTWTTALTGSTNTAMTITLSACGAGNTGTVVVQADRF